MADTGDKEEQPEVESATGSAATDTKDYVAKHRANRKKRLQGPPRNS